MCSPASDFYSRDVAIQKWSWAKATDRLLGHFNQVLGNNKVYMLVMEYNKSKINYIKNGKGIVKRMYVNSNV